MHDGEEVAFDVAPSRVDMKRIASCAALQLCLTVPRGAWDRPVRREDRPTAHHSLRLAGLVVLIVLVGTPHAAERQILGRKIVIGDRTGAEADRVTVVLGRERASDVPGIVGDPTADGATLRIIAAGAAASDEVYVLRANGWIATATGFRFLPRFVGQHPKLSAVIKRTPGNVALLKIVLRGRGGLRSLDVVPPNPGTAGTAVLRIHGGDTYCVAFGGAAGGTSGQNDAERFRMATATSQPACPAFPPQTCCDFGVSTAQCAWASTAEECDDAGGTPGDGGSVCDSASGLCTPPPATPGNCCEGVTTVFGTNCAGGPSTALVCESLGGTLFASAICTPAGDCSSPSGAFLDPPDDAFWR